MRGGGDRRLEWVVRSWAAIVATSAVLLCVAAVEAWASTGAGGGSPSALTLGSLGVSLVTLVGAAVQVGKLQQKVDTITEAMVRAQQERDDYRRQLDSLSHSLADRLAEAISKSIAPAVKAIERDLDRVHPRYEKVEERVGAIETRLERFAAALERSTAELGALDTLRRTVDMLERRQEQ